MKPYPQMPPFTDDELAAFLNEAPVARLCTHNSDGTIHVVAGYFKYEKGEIIMGDPKHDPENQKHHEESASFCVD